MNSKKFYQKPHFYLIAACALLALVSVVLYAVNCPSEFNGGAVSSGVVAAYVLALVWSVLAMACTVLPELIHVPLVAKICSYGRFFKYMAFFALVGGFFTQILAEYSLLGTILYPIFSGTTGDPVDPTLMNSYFTSLIIAFVAAVLAIISGVMERRAFEKQAARAEEAVA